ncbi:MAG TPA: hypothetical protein VH044_05450 [Polyangiaceae bacterium]|jgi:hypothetical protein|nr:hypothetical protein [Polyangiaceae bacterium]
MFDGTGGIVCGTDCDLTKNTCCVDGLGDAKCVNGHSGCGSFGNIGGAAQFQCVQISDCPSGQVCCGYADSSSNLAGSKCQDISANGNKCAPAPTGTMGSVQFCQKTCECKDGSACVAQSCTVMGAPNAMLTMCALQDKAPYNCTPQ